MQVAKRGELRAGAPREAAPARSARRPRSPLGRAHRTDRSRRVPPVRYWGRPGDVPGEESMREDASSKPTPRAPLGGARAVAVASAALALVNTVMITATRPWPLGGARVRATLHLFDVGQHLALGLLAACLCLVSGWALRRPALRGALLVALSAGAGVLALAPDLVGFVGRHATADTATWLRPLLAVALAQCVPVAVLAGRLLGRPGWRWLALAGALVALVANHLLLPLDYPGVHLFVAASAVALMAGALARAPARRPAGGRTLATLVAGLALTAPTLLLLPPNAVRLGLVQVSGSVVAPFQLAWSSDDDDDDAPLASAGSDAESWFADRSAAPAVPPTQPPLLEAPVVLALFVDSLRADVLTRPDAAQRYPHMTRLCREGVDFREARAPGAQTVLTMTSVFTGKYFSQLYWEPHPKHPDQFPHADDSPRVPALLSAAGVDTAHLSAAFWMVDAWGITRGFTEERVIGSSHRTRYAASDDIVTALADRLDRQGDAPFFSYVHLFDAHYVVGRTLIGGKRRPQYDRGLKRVDGQIGRLLKRIAKAGLTDRTIIILTADHGEGLGEHGVEHHSATLYEELIRVPLCVYGPGIEARVVDAPVSLIDLASTLLDLFGLPTPGTFMGQTLVPALKGEAPELTRPIIAEGRLKKTLITPEGLKVIRDDRAHTLEIYDLKADPDESRNLVGTEHPGIDDAVRRLRRFFKVHTLKRPGYTPPFRR